MSRSMNFSEQAWREHQQKVQRWQTGTNIDTLPPGVPTAPASGDRAGLVPAAHPGDRYVLERDVQKAALDLCKRHPRVAWCERFNTGGMYNAAGQYVAFAFEGCSDILGQLKGGRFFAFECKRPGGKPPTPEQWAFLCLVNRTGGLGRVIHSVDEVLEALR